MSKSARAMLKISLVGVSYVNSLVCVRVTGVYHRYWSETGVHHAPLVFQCIYGCSDGRGENGDGNEGSDIPVGGERVNITWPRFDWSMFWNVNVWNVFWTN